MQLRSMVDKSFQYASARNKIRVNPQHGEEEALLILDEWFERKTETGQTTRKTGSCTLEDRV